MASMLFLIRQGHSAFDAPLCLTWSFKALEQRMSGPSETAYCYVKGRRLPKGTFGLTMPRVIGPKALRHLIAAVRKEAGSR